MTGSERPYRTLRELVYARFGVPAVVMGGGPSLPGALERCPGRGDAVYISANDHGAKLAGCDYIVAHDKIEDRIRPFGVPLVSRHLWADIRYLSFPAPNSGVIAAWVAAMLGCAPIYIAGMDCWSGGTYWHNPKAKSAGHLLKPVDHLSRWRHLFVTTKAQFLPIGGALEGAVGSWGVDRYTGPAQRDACLASVAGVTVRFVQDTPLKARTFRAGELAELTQREADRFIATRAAIAA